MKSRAFLLATALLSANAFPAPQETTLPVPGMTCAACPITIKRALSDVNGVERIEVNYPERQVVVYYEDTKTSLRSLIEATTKAGYPAHVEGKNE
jgi:mercuric ion binding protein